MAKQNNTVAWIIGILAVALLLNVGGIRDNLFSGTGDGTGSGDTGSGGNLDATQTFSLACADAYNKGTAVTCGMYYKVNNGQVKFDADGSISVDTGDVVEGIANATGYYSEYFKTTMPSEKTFDQGIDLYSQDTGASIKVYNEDDGLLNSATNSEGLPANEIATLKVQLKSSAEKAIKGATLVLDYVGTNVDDVTSTIGNDISEPSSLTHNTTAGRGSADTFASFVIGDFNTDTSVDQSVKDYYVTVDMGGTAYGLENATVRLMDKDWFVTEQGTFEYGYENDDKTNVGQAHNVFDTLLYTASS